jgi:hypothetical protein
MKRKTILIAGLSMLLLAAMAAPAMAKEDVGVQVGDWFQYEAKITQWDSEMEFLIEGYLGPLTLADNQTDSIIYTVTAITPDTIGDNVTFEITYNWSNGSVTYGNLVEQVATTDQNIFIIGANMTEGDMVSDAYSFMGMADYPARYITSTEDLENPNATRSTNVLIYTVNLMGTDYEYEMWWDAVTGMRVYYWNHAAVPEINFGGTPQPAYEYTLEWSLVDSSVDGVLIPDLTGPILLLTVMSISIPIALLHRRRKRVI